MSTSVNAERKKDFYFKVFLIIISAVTLVRIVYVISTYEPEYEFEKYLVNGTKDNFKSLSTELMDNMFGTLSFFNDNIIGLSRVSNELRCHVFTANLSMISTTKMLSNVEDPRVIPWDSGYLVTLIEHPGSLRQMAFLHNSSDCVVNEKERAIDFNIDGKEQTNKIEKNWMPYTSHLSKDLKLIYSIEPLIILQCDYENIQNCSSITKHKAPINAVPHVLRGGSNAIDLSAYFGEETEKTIIGGFGHTFVKHQDMSTHYPVFFAVEENGKESKVVHLSKPIIFKEIFDSYKKTYIADPVCFGIHNNGSAYLTINFMDRVTRIIFFPIEELIDEIKESMKKNENNDGIKNIHRKVKKMVYKITYSLPKNNDFWDLWFSDLEIIIGCSIGVIILIGIAIFFGQKYCKKKKRESVSDIRYSVANEREESKEDDELMRQVKRSLNEQQRVYVNSL